MFERAGEIVAIMHVLVRPPRESWSRRVSFDSLDDNRSTLVKSKERLSSPVRNMRRVINKSVDDSAERKETLVYHTSLPSTLVLGTRTTDVLGPSEVDEIEFSDPEKTVTRRRGGGRMDRDGEDGVGSTGVVVKFGGCDLSPVAALRKESQCVRNSPNRGLFEALDDDTTLLRIVEKFQANLLGSILMGSHAHGLIRPGRCTEIRREEVAEFFIVKLHEGDFHAEVCGSCFEVLEELKENARNHPC